MDQSEWVSLGEAASILGVHPSTVRHWADSGDLPSQRTPGGHRRFRRVDLDQWARSRSGTPEQPSAEAQLMMQNALGRARLEVSDGQLSGRAWYDQMDEGARRKHGQLGRRLLELLAKALASGETDEETLAEIREIGGEYGRVSYDQNLSLAEAAQAFIFFRDMTTESVVQMAEMLSLRTPSDWGNRLRQINSLTDEMLIALIDTYESQPTG